MTHSESQKDRLIDLLFKQSDHQHQSILLEINRKQALILFEKLLDPFRKSVFFSQDRYFLAFKTILKQYPDFINLPISKEKIHPLHLMIDYFFYYHEKIAKNPNPSLFFDKPYFFFVIKNLIDSASNINLVDDSGYGVIDKVLMKGYAELVVYLINLTSRQNQSEDHQKIIALDNDSKLRALAFALIEKNNDIVQIILQTSPDLTLPINNHQNIFLFVINNCQDEARIIEVFDKLIGILKSNSRFNNSDKEFDNLLVKIFCEYDQKNFNVISYAIQKNYLKLIEKILSFNIPTDLILEDGCDILQFAIRVSKNDQIEKIIIESFQKKLSQNHDLTEQEVKEKLKIFLNRRVCSDKIDDQNINFQEQGAIHFAVNADKLTVVEYLLDKGADPFLRGRKGITPFGLCVDFKKSILAEFFFKKFLQSDLLNKLKEVSIEYHHDQDQPLFSFEILKKFIEKDVEHAEEFFWRMMNFQCLLTKIFEKPYILPIFNQIIYQECRGDLSSFLKISEIAVVKLVTLSELDDAKLMITKLEISKRLILFDCFKDQIFDYFSKELTKDDSYCKKLLGGDNIEHISQAMALNFIKIILEKNFSDLGFQNSLQDDNLSMQSDDLLLEEDGDFQVVDIQQNLIHSQLPDQEAIDIVSNASEHFFEQVEIDGELFELLQGIDVVNQEQWFAMTSIEINHLRCKKITDYLNQNYQLADNLEKLFLEILKKEIVTFFEEISNDLKSSRNAKTNLYLKFIIRSVLQDEQYLEFERKLIDENPTEIKSFIHDQIDHDLISLGKKPATKASLVVSKDNQALGKRKSRESSLE